MKRIRRQLLAAHAETVGDVVDTGAAVAAAIEKWPVTDGDAIQIPLDRLLRRRGLRTQLLATLETGAEAIGEEIRGAPVAAPPYLVVTSRGPLCRGTLTDGRRLVIEFELFEVETQPRRYCFCDPGPEECLQITLAGGGEH
ncbi:MAG: hypothetical protein ACQET5_16320 [Halobacteriota archaeon]